MTFLEPLLLWSLPLALLPIIVHLLNLRRHKRVEWGAMRFLFEATQQRRGQTRLRHLLILLMRVLAVAALLFVICRPMAGRWFGFLGGKPETVIVVLDRSASMAQQDIQSGKSKRSVAVDQISNAIRSAGAPRNLVLIESTSETPRVLEEAASLQEIPETGATDAAADLPTMLRNALEYVVENKTGRTDVWICSDLQSTDWNADGGQWNAIRDGFQELKQPVRFHLLTYPDSSSENVAVRIAKLRRVTTDETNDQLVMDIELRRQNGRERVELPLAVVVDGARSVVDVEFTGEAMLISDHLVPIEKERKAGWGLVELPNDVNPRDNVFYFTYGESITNRTIVVSDEPGSSWPLRLASAPPTEEREASSEIIASANVGEINWKDPSLVLWQANLPTGETQAALEQFVDDGGNVIFFPPPESSDATCFQHRWGDWQKMPAGVKQSVKSWRNDSGLLARSDAGEPLTVNRLLVQDYRDIEGKGQVLAQLDLGEGVTKPLLVRVPTDAGGVYFVSTLPQQPHSNLAREGIVFFSMIQRALRAGAERVLANQFGEIKGAKTGANESSSNRIAWERVNGWPEGALSTEQPYVAGVYRNGDRLIAQNRPLFEDSTARLSDEQLERIMGGLNYRVVRDSVSGSRSLVAEIWRVFSIVLLLALIVEAWLCLPDVRPKKLVTA